MLTSARPPRRLRPRGLAIAYAEDMPELRALISEWLTEAGHAVTCAANGRELGQTCQARRFDLVITDIVMPESDGFDVITTVKKSWPEVKVIAVSGGCTAMAGEDCLRVARRLGADGVLAKPFNRAQFMAAVNAVVRKPRPAQSAAGR